MIHDLGEHHLFGVEQGQGRQVEQAPEKRMGRFNEMQMDVFHENRNRSPSGVARRLRASKSYNCVSDVCKPVSCQSLGLLEVVLALQGAQIAMGHTRAGIHYSTHCDPFGRGHNVMR